MAILMANSDTPLVFDTLAAYKVRYFAGTPAAGKLYCYSRMYSLKGGLALSLYAFEREASSTSRMGFALQCCDDIFFLCVSRELATLHKLSGKETLPQQAESAELMCTMPVGFFSGIDEQGWYWGAEVTLSQSLLQRAGCNLQSHFKAAMYKYHMEEDAFGASTRAATEGPPMHSAALDEFEIV